MFCAKCGSANDDSALFCSRCGASLTPASQPEQNPRYFTQQPSYQPTYTSTPPQQPNYQPQQPNYQPQQPNYQPSYAQIPPQPETLGMGWFKFLIYFALFAGAVLNALTAISMLTGSMYGESKDLVYLFYKDLKTVDTIVGVATLALAVLGIYARFRLSGFHTNGPKMLTYTYALSAVIGIVYFIGIYSVLPEEVMALVDTSQMLSSTVVSFVMIFVNKAYFNKRKHLFVNS